MDRDFFLRSHRLTRRTRRDDDDYRTNFAEAASACAADPDLGSHRYFARRNASAAAAWWYRNVAQPKQLR